jgi:hypothetical protein
MSSSIIGRCPVNMNILDLKTEGSHLSPQIYNNDLLEIVCNDIDYISAATCATYSDSKAKASVSPNANCSLFRKRLHWFWYNFNHLQKLKV